MFFLVMCSDNPFYHIASLLLSYQCRSISVNLIKFMVLDFLFGKEFSIFVHGFVCDDQ